jgi:hypothetical protein
LALTLPRTCAGRPLATHSVGQRGHRRAVRDRRHAGSRYREGHVPHPTGPGWHGCSGPRARGSMPPSVRASDGRILHLR